MLAQFHVAKIISVYFLLYVKSVLVFIGQLLGAFPHNKVGVNFPLG